MGGRDWWGGRNADVIAGAVDSIKRKVRRAVRYDVVTRDPSNRVEAEAEAEALGPVNLDSLVSLGSLGSLGRASSFVSASATVKAGRSD